VPPTYSDGFKLPKYWAFRSARPRDHIILSGMNPGDNKSDEKRPKALCGLKPKHPWSSGFSRYTATTCVTCARAAERLGIKLPT
jgi:hypothetical protein